jgi:hypothetical protein
MNPSIFPSGMVHTNHGDSAFEQEEEATYHFQQKQQERQHEQLLAAQRAANDDSHALGRRQHQEREEHKESPACISIYIDLPNSCPSSSSLALVLPEDQSEPPAVLEEEDEEDVSMEDEDYEEKGMEQGQQEKQHMLPLGQETGEEGVAGGLLSKMVHYPVSRPFSRLKIRFSPGKLSHMNLS